MFQEQLGDLENWSRKCSELAPLADDSSKVRAINANR